MKIDSYCMEENIHMLLIHKFNLKKQQMRVYVTIKL